MFNTKELTFIGLMSASMFVLALLLGSSLNAATGIPIASAIIGMFIQGIFVTISIFTIKKFWVGSSMYLIYGILAAPTTLLGGVPGVIKIIMAPIGMGLVLDLIINWFNYKKTGFYVAFAIMNIISMLAGLAVYYFLKVPNFNQIASAMPMIIGITTVTAILGVATGFKIFSKIKNKQAIQRIVSQ